MIEIFNSNFNLLRDGACPLEDFLKRPGKGIINSTAYTKWYQEKPNTSKFHWIKQANTRGNIVFSLRWRKCEFYISNLSASRLPTVGRITGDATFLKGLVSQVSLAQLVAELDNSLVSWVGLSHGDAKRFSSTTVHLLGAILKAPPKFKKSKLFI